MKLLVTHVYLWIISNCNSFNIGYTYNEDYSQLLTERLMVVLYEGRYQYVFIIIENTFLYIFCDHRHPHNIKMNEDFSNQQHRKSVN